MLTEMELGLCVEYLQGSCQIVGGFYTALGRELTDAEELQLEKYLIDIELFECEGCGWWGFPGEPLDVNGFCSECAEQFDSEEF